MRMIKDVNEFDTVIQNGSVLVDFFATWCGPCKMLTPVLEQLAEEYQGKVEIVKVDVDELGDIAARYGIMSIPTLFMFKDGELKEKVVGFQPKPALAKMIERNL